MTILNSKVTILLYDNYKKYSTFPNLIVAKVTSDANGEANPDFDNSGAPESFFVKNKKKFEK